MSRFPDPDRASSPVIGVLLVIGITFILAMLVLILCSGFRLPSAGPDDTFRIKTITYIPDTSGTGIRGLVTVSNTGSKDYRNRYLGVITYVNGARANCNIPTLNNELFCSLNHYGVWHLSGVGTWGNKDFPTSVWPGHSDIAIEYKKGIMRPGDRVTLEVIDTTTNRVVSRDTFPHSTTRDAGWFYNYFL